VPVAAAFEAEVGAADADPPVLGGRGDHRLDQVAVGILEGDALGERALGVGDPAGERVADALQLTEVEDPARPGGVDPVRDDHASEPLGDQPRQLALQPPDLTPQLDAGQALIYLKSLEYSRHKQILSRLEGGGGNP
jgi:hypothetical protein